MYRELGELIKAEIESRGGTFMINPIAGELIKTNQFLQQKLLFVVLLLSATEKRWYVQNSYSRCTRNAIATQE